MSLAKKFEQAQNLFFVAGFTAAQLRSIPFLLIGFLANIGALFFYSVAYSLWLISSHLYPDYPGLSKYWYGFAEFKHQHRAAALLGLVSMIFFLTALWVPLMIIPGVWFVVASNSIWSISEYHKMKNPPDFDKSFSTKQQQAFLHFTIALTLVTLVVAIATTAIIFFPPATLSIFTIATIAEIGTGLVALERWIAFKFTNYLPDNKYQEVCLGPYAKLSLKINKKGAVNSLPNIVEFNQTIFDNYKPLFIESKKVDDPPNLSLSDNQPCNLS